MARLESAFWNYEDGVYSISTEEDSNNIDKPRIDKSCMRFHMTPKEFIEFAKSIELVLTHRRYVMVSDKNVKNNYEAVVQKFHEEGYTIATKTNKYTVFTGIMQFTKTHDILTIDLIQNELYTGYIGTSHIGIRVEKE